MKYWCPACKRIIIRDWRWKEYRGKKTLKSFCNKTGKDVVIRLEVSMGNELREELAEIMKKYFCAPDVAGQFQGSHCIVCGMPLIDEAWEKQRQTTLTAILDCICKKAEGLKQKHTEWCNVDLSDESGCDCGIRERNQTIDDLIEIVKGEK